MPARIVKLRRPLASFGAPRVTNRRVKREFSAGAVVVRRLKGRLVAGGDPPGRQAGRDLGASEGADRAGRLGRRDRPARGRRGDGPRGPARRQARRHPLRLHMAGRAHLQGRLLLPRPLQPRPDRRHPAGARARGGRGALAPARGRAEPPRVQGRAGDGLRGAAAAYDPPSLYALNFYNPMVADQLRNGRKTATIRLGDKSAKYKKGRSCRCSSAPATGRGRRSSTP